MRHRSGSKWVGFGTSVACEYSQSPLFENRDNKHGLQIVYKIILCNEKLESESCNREFFFGFVPRII